MSPKKYREKSEKKILLTFAVIVLASGFVGGLLGRATLSIDRDALAAFGEAMIPVLVVLLPAVLFLGNLILFLLAMGKYSAARKWFAQLDEDDEAQYERIESNLDYPILYGNIALIANLFLFSAGIELSNSERLSYVQSNAVLLVTLAVFILGIIWTIAVQNAAVKLEKKLNPEKRGSVFEMNFQKIWNESCDEGEKLMIYKAGYKAFSIVNKLCLFMWLATFFAQFIFHTGVYPVICVCIIHLVAVVSYSLEAMKLEHPRK